MLRVLDDELRNRLRDAIDGYEKTCPVGPDDLKSGQAEALLPFIRQDYATVDEFFQIRSQQVEEAGHKVQCGNCKTANCCYDYAIVTPPEMVLVIDAFQRLDVDDQLHVARQNWSWSKAHKPESEVFPIVMDEPKQGAAYYELMEEEGLSADRMMIGMTTERSFREKTPCSFLKDNRCMIYEDRPLACRGHNSIDPRGPKVCTTVLWDMVATKVKRFDMADICAAAVRNYMSAGLPMHPNGELNAVLARWLQQQATLANMDTDDQP